MSGAVVGNTNAAKHGLYSSRPSRLVHVPVDVSVVELGTFAADLGDGAMWVAEALEEMQNHFEALDVSQMIGLYASVAAELAQVAAELVGETGIKPAPLGRLTDEQYELLIKKQTAALSLILSQCVSAWKNLQDRQEVEKERGLLIMATRADGHTVERVHYVLDYLAAHMRSAKRMLRELAANRIWKLRGVEDEDDLGAKLMKVIGVQE